MLRMRARRRRRRLLGAVGPTLAAAVLGNAFVGSDALRWFREDLDRPATLPPLRLFVVVGIVYYAIVGTVRYRALTRGDRRTAHLTLAVLAGNELWNAVFFGQRSTRNGFLGMVAFAVSLAALQRSVAEDRPSSALLAPYSAWVAYDLVWMWQLWRRTREARQEKGDAGGVSAGHGPRPAPVGSGWDALPAFAGRSSRPARRTGRARDPLIRLST